MKLHDWKYTIKNIASYPSGVKSLDESVMANAVNAANYDLVKQLKPTDKILEIGCGAASYLRDHIPGGATWDGIDVYEKDSRGRKCIATRLGSVHCIPFENDVFDVVLSNQSIEHWFEYDVELEQGLSEIARVLRVDGRAYLNFPFYLHGHPLFVTGDLDGILSFVDADVWEVEDIVAFEDSEESNYVGWQRCGFPDFYVQRLGETHTSYVVELVLRKKSSIKNELPEQPSSRQLDIPSRLSANRRALVHGIDVFLWKLLIKVTRGRTGKG